MRLQIKSGSCKVVKSARPKDYKASGGEPYSRWHLAFKIHTFRKCPELTAEFVVNSLPKPHK